MVFIDAYTDAVLITSIPPIAVLAFLLIRGENKKQLYFVIGFLSITAFYIYATDPSLVASLYTSQGNYTFPIEVSILATGFLFVAIFFFRKHLAE